MLPPLSRTMMSAVPALSVHHAMPLEHHQHPRFSARGGKWNPPSQKDFQFHHLDMAYHTTAPVTSFTDATGQTFQLDTDTNAVWQLDGPINFVSMFAIDNMIQDLQATMGDKQTVVVDMAKVTNLEFTGMEELVTRLIETDLQIKMVNCNEAVQQALDQCDPKQQIQRFATLTAV